MLHANHKFASATLITKAAAENDASRGIAALLRKGRSATIRAAVVKKPLDRTGKSDQNGWWPRWLIAP
jgi:hypothetical protein